MKVICNAYVTFCFAYVQRGSKMNRTRKLLHPEAHKTHAKQCSQTKRWIAFDGRRKLLKKNPWPQLYEADVRVLDAKAGCERTELVSFLLPHEVVDALASRADRSTLLENNRMDPLTKRHLESCKDQAGSELLGCGLWGDGMPCNWNREESVDAISLNFPGFSDKFRSLRVPLVAIPHGLLSENTWFDIMAIIKESFVALAVGRHWTERHDGKPWKPRDAKRKKAAGKPLVTKAALVEVRAGWEFYKEVFAFPAWNEKQGCCWICRCTPEQVVQIKSWKTFGFMW